MKLARLFFILLALVPCIAFAAVNENFESYTDDADWVAQGRGGWVLTGADDFDLADNVVQGGVNTSSKCLHITSAPGTSAGYLKIGFPPMQEGALKFKVRYPAAGGSLNYCAFVMGGDNPTLFAGVFYEYLNDLYFQYGNQEPFGGFQQDAIGNLSGDWHQFEARWTADGRLSVKYDGVDKVADVPLRDDLASGMTYLTLYTPDGTGTTNSGSDIYIDDVFVGDPSIVLDQKFEDYEDNAAWVADSRSGWALSGSEDIVLADNPMRDGVNPSDKVLHISPAAGSAGGNVKINFGSIPNGTLTFKSYAPPPPEGEPYEYATWGVYSDTPYSCFAGVFYEYLNRIYAQYGNVEPLGGFETVEMGTLSSRWHTVHVTWNENGRVNMWEDGVKYVDDKPMREPIGAGIEAFLLGCPGANPGSSTYVDDLVVREGVFLPVTSIIQDFEDYADNSDWLARGRSGWVLDGTDEFQVVANPLVTATNSSDKCLQIVSPADANSGSLAINFTPVKAGRMSYDVYSPATGGTPYHYSTWATYAEGNATFQGMFYEMLNMNQFAFGSDEPYGGYANADAGLLSGGWHKIIAEWDSDGRLNMWQDGTQYVTDKPMRSALGAGLSRFLLATFVDQPTNVYVDNLKFESIVMEQVATPVFTPDGGNYVLPQNVTMTCATDGADIYYTLDGSPPDESDLLYDGTSVSVSENTTMKARAFKTGYVASDVKSATYVFLTELNRPAAIPYTSSTMTIDGDLSDWAGSQWAPLDVNYYFNPSDIAVAKYAAKWGENGNKVYVAVRVRDTFYKFTDYYTEWDVRDGIEVYIHTTGTGPSDYSSAQVDAQEYTFGFKTGSNTTSSSIWSAVGRTEALLPQNNPIPSGACDAAGKIVVDAEGEWLQYEMAITPYHRFSLDGTGLVVSPLSSGDIIGLDVVVASVNPVRFAMKAENDLNGKSTNYNMFGQHVLVDTSNIADAKKAADGAGVGVSGVVSAVFTDYFYVESADRAYGIRVDKTDHGLSVGQTVSSIGVIDTLESGERYVAGIGVTVSGTGSVEPLGVNNKSLGGGDFGTLPNGQAGVADGTGLNNIGLLVKTTGKVGTKGTDWFMIDDGSGVSVKVFGAVPAGTPYVTVTGISSCEKDTGGAIQRAILATNIQVNVP